MATIHISKAFRSPDRLGVMQEHATQYTLTLDDQEILILEAAMLMMSHHADQGDPPLQDIKPTIDCLNEMIHETCVDAGFDQEDFISYTT